MNEVKRFCVDCLTTTTPLWRSGPHGPRSLCNACGIKYRKRKAAENRINTENKSEKSSSNCRSVNHHMDDTLNMRFYNEYGSEMIIQRPLSSSSSSSSPFSQVKKQRSKRESSDNSNNSWEYSEVEEAAVLLMTLSSHYVFS